MPYTSLLGPPNLVYTYRVLGYHPSDAWADPFPCESHPAPVGSLLRTSRPALRSAAFPRSSGDMYYAGAFSAVLSQDDTSGYSFPLVCHAVRLALVSVTYSPFPV